MPQNLLRGAKSRIKFGRYAVRAGEYVNRELAQEVEIAREKAWRDIFFNGGFRP